MTELRDARLERALNHAPDAQLRPDAAVRAAVLRAAHDAVAQAPAAAPQTGWWARRRGAGGRPGGARMPWNAAFATVLVAGIAALLWHGQEVPDARLDAPAAVAPSQAPAPAPATAPAPAPATKAAPEVPRRAEELAKERRRADAPAPAPAPAPATAEPAAPPPVPAQGPAPAPAPAPAAKAQARLEAFSPDAIEGFTELRVLAGARSASVSRDQATALPGLMRALTAPSPALAGAPRPAAADVARQDSADAAAASAAAPATPGAGMAAERSAARGAVANAVQEPPLRIELRRGNEISGTLEISGGRWRLQGADGSVRTGPADAAAVQALRAELGRLGLL